MIPVPAFRNRRVAVLGLGKQASVVTLQVEPFSRRSKPEFAFLHLPSPVHANPCPCRRFRLPRAICFDGAVTKPPSADRMRDGPIGIAWLPRRSWRQPKKPALTF